MIKASFSDMELFAEFKVVKLQKKKTTLDVIREKSFVSFHILLHKNSIFVFSNQAKGMGL